MAMQSGSGVMHNRDDQYVDNVGLHVHAPDEPHNPAHPHEQEVILLV